MNNTPGRTSRVLGPVLLILVLLNILLMTRLLWPVIQDQAEPVAAAANPTRIASPTASPQPTFTSAPAVSMALPENISQQDGLRQQGIIVLSMRDGGYFHLFAYNPQYLPLTRLTGGNWDDISPAISPDLTHIAFSSNQRGTWDLYVMDLASGQLTQLTNTPAYDGAPEWSPDGKWLAYESYQNDQLDIYLLSAADPTQPPVQLTEDPAADYAPAWSGDGRQLAFVSTRGGEEDIWLAKLDDTGDRFTNLSRDLTSRDTAPAWSADGRLLAWSAKRDGVNSLVVWDSQQPQAGLRAAGDGVDAIWSPDGGQLLAEVETPNAAGISIYSAGSGLAVLPFTALPGDLDGLAWKNGAFAENLAPRLAASPTAPAPLYTTNLTAFPINPAGRFSVVELKDVTAPYPMLHDSANESFEALRLDIAGRTGWDFLASLENAFIPVTRPTSPGMDEDWLYTGRGIATNSVLIHAGWMAVAREDFNGRTYWRIYLKARYQDGSQGRPLTAEVWDFDARYNGDPKVYEQGGQSGAIPSGYWIDFTGLARAYTWERLPALVSWLNFYQAARFNQFAFTEGLDWKTALFELYPPEAVATPTPASSIPTPAATAPVPGSP